GEERGLGLAQVAGYRVEPDPAEPGDDLLLGAGRRYHEDLAAGLGHHPGAFGEPAVGRHVERAAQVGGGEVVRVAGVDDGRAAGAAISELRQWQRPRA